MPVKTVKLNNGTEIPAIGLGTWLSDKGEVGEAVKVAFDKGYTHIDGAQCYANEKEIGETYAETLKEGKLKREDIYIVSKLWCKFFAKEDVIPSCKATLADLQIDYLDLFLVHLPFRLDKIKCVGGIPDETKEGLIGYSPELMKETWEQMEALVELGLVKSIGVSNFTVKKLQELLEFAKIKPVCNQVEMHPYLPQNNLKAFCDKHDIVCVAFSPLGAPGRPQLYVDDSQSVLLEDSVVKSIADKHKCTAAQVLISWGVNRGTVALPKSVKPNRIEENLKSADVSLDTDDMLALNAIKTRVRYLDQNWAVPKGGNVHDLWDGEYLG